MLTQGLRRLPASLECHAICQTRAISSRQLFKQEMRRIKTNSVLPLQFTVSIISIWSFTEAPVGQLKRWCWWQPKSCSSVSVSTKYLTLKSDTALLSPLNVMNRTSTPIVLCCWINVTGDISYSTSTNKPLSPFQNHPSSSLKTWMKPLDTCFKLSKT